MADERNAAAEKFHKGSNEIVMSRFKKTTNRLFFTRLASLRENFCISV
jgi:hypothetical protein